MYASPPLFLATIALLCSAFAHDAPQTCIASYGSANGGLDICNAASVEWMKGLAKNCTAGDLAAAYATLSQYCDDPRQAHGTSPARSHVDGGDLSHAHEDYPSRIVMRRPSRHSDEESIATDQTASGGSTVEPQEWQSSSSRSKQYAWAWEASTPDAFSFTNIFAERSVRFALSGLLLTTLTSFLFL